MTSLHEARKCAWCETDFKPRTKGKQPVQQYCKTACGKAHNTASYDLGKCLVEALPLATVRAHYEAMQAGDK